MFSKKYYVNTHSFKIHNDVKLVKKIDSYNCANIYMLVTWKMGYNVSNVENH